MDRNRTLWWRSGAVAVGTLLALVMCPTAAGQKTDGPKPAGAGGALPPLPSIIRHEMEQLGSRLSAFSTQQLAVTGTLTDENGAKVPVRLVYQAPGLFRLDTTAGADSKSVVFDGTNARSKDSDLGKNEERLLESLWDDTADGILALLTQGGALHLLGRGFHPASADRAAYQGPYYDIYELFGPVQTKGAKDRKIVAKRLYYDSQTALLVSVRYEDVSEGVPVKVQTRFSGWHDAGGTLVPGRIERLENGAAVLAFELAGAQLGTASEPSAFVNP